MSSFLGIAREYVFSPGRESDDDAVLAAVAERLRAAGHGVSVCRGDDPAWPEVGRETLVFAMCQSDAALQRLQRMEDSGFRVVNRPQSILNCMRHRAIPALAAAGVRMPESRLLAASDPLPDLAAAGPVWLKRGDVHAVESEDVVFASDAQAARVALRRFAARGIARVVVQRHVAGTVVKFYAVENGFFHHVPPETGADLSAAERRAVAELGARAAAVLGVEVYGGDCVVQEGAEPVLIDLNDWPSYASCRVEASKAIAAHLQARSGTIPPSRPRTRP